MSSSRSVGVSRLQWLIVMMAVLVLTGFSFAQSTTDGAISGTVYDANGALLPHAAVTVRNNGTNLEQHVSSGAVGDYHVLKLQPGVYTIRIEANGFAAFNSNDVIVEVGKITEVSPRLAPGGDKETVTVVDAAPDINTTNASFSPSLDQTQIANLPINGGRWSDFSRLTPTVVANTSGFGLISFRGISVLLNNNTVDGADNNQAFFSEERGRTRIGYSTPIVAIQEFEVNTSNYSSEYGRAAGGVINTVTKSGGNKIHGEAFFYDRDNDWGATNPFTTLTRQTSPGVFTTSPYKPTDWRKRVGFGVGGPFIKDRLFWFLAFDYYDRNFPGTAVPSNPAIFFATPSAATINTLATRLGVTPAQATTIYNNDLNGLLGLLGPVPRTGESYIFFPKVDWEINEKNHASFELNRMRWASPAGIQTQASNTFGAASFGNDFVKDTWGVAKLDTFLTPSVSNQIRFQYGRDFEFEFGQNPTAYEQQHLLGGANPPGFNNPSGIPPQVSITNGFTFGLPTFLERPAFPDETRTQVADTLTWVHGNHTLKFGIDFSYVNDLSQNLRTQYGSFSYSSLLNYFSDLGAARSCSSGGTAVPCYSSFSQAFGPIGFEFATHDSALFAEDTWKVSRRLSLSYGIRWEYEALPSAILGNAAVPQTGNLPNVQANFGPHAGFAWDIFGDSKTVVRGGYGLYYGRVINSTIYNALTATGAAGSQISIFLSPTSSSPTQRNCTPTFPIVFASQPACAATGASSIAFFDPEFRVPEVHQFDLSVERAVGWNSIVSVSYLGSLGRHLPGFADTNICIGPGNPAPSCGAVGTRTYTVQPGGPLTAATYTTPFFTQRAVSTFGAMTDIFSGINSNYNALVVQVNHRMSHHIQFGANYTWSHALDFGQNESTFSDTNDLLVPFNIAPEYGNSIYDVRHRFVLNTVAESPWRLKGWAGVLANDWQLSPVYTYQTGLPYSLKTSGSSSGGIGSGVNGSNGDFRIDVLGRNSFRMPNTWVADLRVAKHFHYRERYGLELSSDFFNVANHVNVTQVATTGYIVGGTAAAPTLTLPSSPSVPFQTVQNGNSNFTYSPRQIQLGARVTF